VDRSPDTPQFWFLGAFSLVATAWAGIAVAVVLALAILSEVHSQRQVRDNLRSLDRYLPPPTAWQRSAELVRYNVPCGAQ
jgi:hypothetical protein